MTLSNFLVQLLNGLAGASSLFLVAAGLSLIFGISRIVNFAHGSLYMLGLYIAYSFTERFGASAAGWWCGVLAAALVTGALGAAIEILLLRRIYRAPELFQLLATFALVLVIKDATLATWGAEDLLGRRAPGLAGAVAVAGQHFPQYKLLLIAVGPLVLAALWLLLTRSRWGTLVRAATQDREMVGALGVNSAWLFTGVFALGAFLAGLGGAMALPNEPANLDLDLQTIGDAFVVVVVGGLGSLPGAYLAALLIGIAKAMCAAIGTVEMFGVAISFSKLTLVVEFLIMAIVLILRPWGLLGRPQVPVRIAEAELPLRPAGRRQRFVAGILFALLLALPIFAQQSPYALTLGIDILIAVLFAASLHFLMGPAGMHSFGHAAYFGLGAYGAALFFKALALPMAWSLAAAPLVAGLGAAVFGWFCVRLSGVYLAMLTLAFAQIVWSVVYQTDALTGGSNGIVGIWPPDWLADKRAYFLLTLLVCGGCVLLLRRILFSPFGFALRAGRDAPLRADAIGIDVRRIQWLGFIIAGLFCGVAGALFAFAKGSISPETISVGRSVDGLVMVLLGGVHTLSGPIVGGAVYTWLADWLARETDYWRGALGITILTLVLAFPQGIVGTLRRRFSGDGV
ncbi:ABC transporter permease [Noviherbaspirillum pedocola]|uniref:ABC transporter permease n=1 Tax=Noviherbaspirillum pedocola TaxID=2801341 RepID=A0A934T1F2_9BURK|nr:ABC transporter permease [Noviherbaspirillum pedocola]MBK4737222.1 ABC transporter permease [Noviherbaspirillum pedocola]